MAQVNAGQQIFFQNSFGRPGMSHGFDDNWKDVGEFYTGLYNSPFSIRNLHQKGGFATRVTLVWKLDRDCD